MSGPVFNWPDEAGESVVAARGRLLVAGERLAARSFEERLEAAARVVDAWSAADSPWRRTLCDSLSARSGFHPNTLAEGLDSALRAWSSDAFKLCARREILEMMRAGARELAPFACTSVLAGGSIPMPTLLSGILPLVLGSPVLLRETSKDSISAGLLARSIAEIDSNLGDCIEVVRFPVEDEAAMAAFLEAPCVVATGSDATLSSISNRLTPDQRFVAYGHRFSIAVLGPQSARADSDLEGLADGLALDVARWDQSGCLSPVVLYLVGVSTANARRLAERISISLEGRSTSMPRGEVSAESLAAHSIERSEARMRAAVRSGAHFFEGEDFAVSLEAENRPRPAPLSRFLHILPVDSLAMLERVLRPFSAHLSTAAIAGFDGPEVTLVTGTMARLGVSRVCAPGRLQTPPIDWPHDGRPLFIPMARFFQGE